ncbi:hypothetical protein CC80DRAFT_194302 [Byssothecium circinans]|uniref:Secreted protein n=1 Tax=Byssothecium circinans TaxID=147558 RepID=A0A6A5U8U0_9PLEO|nr:hypothetical protein CC80DRAFT_194302 [Byssothecium circinans]
MDRHETFICGCCITILVLMEFSSVLFSISGGPSDQSHSQESSPLRHPLTLHGHGSCSTGLHMGSGAFATNNRSWHRWRSSWRARAMQCTKLSASRPIRRLLSRFATTS